MNREQMQMAMVKKFGHEHKVTIWFCQFCEEHANATDEQIKQVYDALVELVEYGQTLAER